MGLERTRRHIGFKSGGLQHRILGVAYPTVLWSGGKAVSVQLPDTARPKQASIGRTNSSGVTMPPA
jgi:hypothetical protein